MPCMVPTIILHVLKVYLIRMQTISYKCYKVERDIPAINSNFFNHFKNNMYMIYFFIYCFRESHKT